jgi:hypothetical protein
MLPNDCAEAVMWHQLRFWHDHGGWPCGPEKDAPVLLDLLQLDSKHVDYSPAHTPTLDEYMVQSILLDVESAACLWIWARHGAAMFRQWLEANPGKYKTVVEG